METNRSIVWLWLLISSGFLHQSFGETPEAVMYSDVTPANRNVSMDKIRALPIKTYEFIYDKVAGRKHIGVLATDAATVVPESIEIIAKYPIPAKDKSQPPLILQNFPLVDKNVLFMHGLATLQELLDRYESMRNQMEQIQVAKDSHLMIFEDIKKRLDTFSSSFDVDNANLEELEAKVAEKEMQLEKAKADERSARLREEIDGEKKLLEYEEQLARQRMSMQEQLARDSMLATLEQEKRLAEKREETRLQNAQTLEAKRSEYNKQLEEAKSSNAVELIKAEVAAKAEQERANEDLHIRKLQAQAKLDTARIVDSITAVSQQLGALLHEFLSRPYQIAAVVGALMLVLAAYYLFRQLVSMLRSYIQSRFGRPSLVRETSYSWSILPMWLTWEYWRSSSLTEKTKQLESEFSKIILSSEDRLRVLQLSLSTRNTRATGAPYRHILLHGPPGTGKTLIARQLARSSGMDYAIMSGGDVGPLGEDAVDQLHGLFKWAARSRKGLLLFIDEAEAFLSSRKSKSSVGGDGESAGISDANIRHALNALLYQTGTQSKAFMLVLATNRPEDLDPAVLDRIDVSMLISLPALSEREAMVEMYLQQYVGENAAKSQKSWKYRLGFSRSSCSYEPECLAVETIRQISVRCDGFSGREISKMCISAQYAMMLAEGQRLSLKLLLSTVESKVADHTQTRKFVLQQKQQQQPQQQSPKSPSRKSVIPTTPLFQYRRESGSSSNNSFTTANGHDRSNGKSDGDRVEPDVTISSDRENRSSESLQSIPIEPRFPEMNETSNNDGSKQPTVEINQRNGSPVVAASPPVVAIVNGNGSSKKNGKHGKGGGKFSTQ